jgi:DNA repair protein RadC
LLFCYIITKASGGALEHPFAFVEGYRAIRRIIAGRRVSARPSTRAGACRGREQPQPEHTIGAVDPYLVHCLRALDHEALLCLYYGQDGSFCGQRGRQGGAASVPTDAAALARGALENDARYVVMAHNHPSGDPTPSRQDIDITRRLALTLVGLDMRLADHVIVARGGAFFSFRNAGLI